MNHRHGPTNVWELFFFLRIMFGNFSLKLEEPHNFTPTIIDKHYAKKVDILTELKWSQSGNVDMGFGRQGWTYGDCDIVLKELGVVSLSCLTTNGTTTS